MVDRRPRLALPFTILESPDTVRLVAGEDQRYTFSATGLQTWLPAVLRRCDGTHAVSELAAGLSADHAEALLELIRRLYGERVLVEGTAAEAHAQKRHDRVAVLFQDRLDPHAALAFNHQQLEGTHPFLWVTTGPMRRAYISPPFFPRIGPCLACLVESLRRLSPLPTLHSELVAHAAAGNDIPAVPFPEDLLNIVQGIVKWKLDALATPVPPAALYRLHVLEADSLEVTTHRVYRDPECAACRRVF